MKKPETFLQEVWEQLSDAEKKEVYLTDLTTSENAPCYLYGLFEDLDLSIDNKITIAEKILNINKEPLTDKEKKAIGLTAGATLE